MAVLTTDFAAASRFAEFLPLRVVQKCVAGALIHFDLEFLFVMIERVAKHGDFGFRRPVIFGTEVAKHRRGNGFQLFRIGKDALIKDHSGGKRFGLRQSVKRETAAHAEAEYGDLLFSNPGKLAQIGNAVDDVIHRTRNIE